MFLFDAKIDFQNRMWYGMPSHYHTLARTKSLKIIFLSKYFVMSTLL